MRPTNNINCNFVCLAINVTTIKLFLDIMKLNYNFCQKKNIEILPQSNATKTAKVKHEIE